MAEESTRDVPITWVGLEDEPVYAANQFISQHHNGQFVLSLGMLVPPPILGTEEQKAKQIERINHVTVRPLIRVALTPEVMDQLIGVLQQNRERAQGRNDASDD